MTNHTDTSRSDDLVERLRGDWPEILVEKHWMMDSDAIDKQREEAADRIEALEAENERLREALLFYANIKNYRHIIGVNCTSVDIDAGDTARAALETKHD